MAATEAKALPKEVRRNYRKQVELTQEQIKINEFFEAIKNINDALKAVKDLSGAYRKVVAKLRKYGVGRITRVIESSHDQATRRASIIKELDQLRQDVEEYNKLTTALLRTFANELVLAEKLRAKTLQVIGHFLVFFTQQMADKNNLVMFDLDQVARFTKEIQAVFKDLYDAIQLNVAEDTNEKVRQRLSRQTIASFLSRVNKRLSAWWMVFRGEKHAEKRIAESVEKIMGQLPKDLKPHDIPADILETIVNVAREVRILEVRLEGFRETVTRTITLLDQEFSHVHYTVMMYFSYFMHDPDVPDDLEKQIQAYAKQMVENKNRYQQELYAWDANHNASMAKYLDGLNQALQFFAENAQKKHKRFSKNPALLATKLQHN